MGIARLNQFLRAHGGDAIRLVTLEELSGRHLAVDASIYMYRFLGERSLLAGIYQMVTLLRRQNITPVFVFDGAPPREKQATQAERHRRKEEAFQARQDLEERIRTRQVNMSRATQAELYQLRRRSLRLGRYRVSQVRQLLSLCGVPQIEAQGEADTVCAALVTSGECWGCLSEDTDMFVCGCARVLRYLSLAKGTCVLYDWDRIRLQLQIPQPEFQLVCAAAGSDYGAGVTGMGIVEAWEAWEAWVGTERPGELSAHLASGDELTAERIRGAAAVFQSPLSGPPVPQVDAPNTAGIRAFLTDFGFVFVDAAAG
jgi:flap endonuclease-1